VGDAQGKGPDRVIFLRAILITAVAALVLGNCAKKEEILEGQRFDVRTPLTEAFADANTDATDTATANRAVAIKLPRTVNLTSWTHRNGRPDHHPGHPALSSNLTHLWSVNIGSGNGRKHRLTADPVVAGGLIFTLDSQSRVMAHSPIGAAVWVRDLTPASEKQGEATGGGLAYDGGVLFATSGFGEVTAMRAEDGQVQWRQRLDAPVSSAPTVFKDRVYVVSRDNRAWSLKAGNGRIDWQQQSTTGNTGLMGGGAPAAGGKNVILPFSSGEMVAAMTRNGLRVWSVAVSGSRLGQARSNIGDISSDPVMADGRVYAGNQSGRITAVGARDGERIWTANEGSYSPVWPVGNSVFLVSDAAQLVRLDARNGQTIWAVDLPGYKREKKHREAFAHYGPVLAKSRPCGPKTARSCGASGLMRRSVRRRPCSRTGYM